MTKAKRVDIEKPDPVIDDEDEKTLDAIDEGLRDVALGRTVPANEVRQHLPQWTTPSSSRKER
jgi:predicted transcriptional regulator